jgi:Mce-associated membrane protein
MSQRRPVNRLAPNRRRPPKVAGASGRPSPAGVPGASSASDVVETPTAPPARPGGAAVDTADPEAGVQKSDGPEPSAGEPSAAEPEKGLAPPEPYVAAASPQGRSRSVAAVVAAVWGFLRALPAFVRAMVATARRLGRGPWLAVIFLAGAIVLAGLAVLAWFKPGADPDNQAFVDTAETSQVKAAAVHALTTIDSYQADKMDGFKDRVRPVLTDSMYREFLKTADATIDFAKQSQTDTQANVDPVGVTMLDTRHGRAELVVDLTVSGTRNGAATTSGQDSLVVRMQKVDGHWLVSDIPDHG